MTGRFFALDSTYGCKHGVGMGCDKCYWKHMRKPRPAVIVTLVAADQPSPPPPPPEESEQEGYPVVNDYDQAFIMPNSPW